MWNNISFSQDSSIEEIREKIFNNIKQLQPSVEDNIIRQAAEILIKKCYGWLSCPAANGMRIHPQRCMMCECGHMTECHYPFDCEHANCSHLHKYNYNLQDIDEKLEPQRYLIVFEKNYRIFGQTKTRLSDLDIKNYIKYLSLKFDKKLNYSLCDFSPRCSDCVHQLQCNEYKED
jgi:hypothetical protein